MNKQEVIEKIKNLEGLTILDKTINFDSEMISKKEVFNIINQIDEPEKPVVPQYVADWYEKHKGNLEYDIYYDLCIKYHKRELDGKLRKWFGNDSKTNPIETLIKMKLYSYDVVGTLYEVFLVRSGLKLSVVTPEGEDKSQFTAKELEGCGFDDSDVYDVREVKEWE